MSKPKQILEAFGDMGHRHALDLKGGRHYEGYILEVRDEYLLFALGGPEAPDEPVPLPIEEVDLGSLSYWDWGRGCWMDARWDETTDAWLLKPSRPPAKGGVRSWWKFWT